MIAIVAMAIAWYEKIKLTPVFHLNDQAILAALPNLQFFGAVSVPVSEPFPSHLVVAGVNNHNQVTRHS